MIDKILRVLTFYCKYLAPYPKYFIFLFIQSIKLYFLILYSIFKKLECVWINPVFYNPLQFAMKYQKLNLKL